MNFGNILNEIEKVDPEVFEKTSPRRHIFKSFGAKVAVAALPFAIGSMFKKAYGQSSTADIVSVLNFALTLEYLEAEFYNTALMNPALFPSAAANGAIQTIANHENAHVAFLRTAIGSLAGTPVSKPVFDFSAGNGSGTGPFADVFINYATFLAVAQTFEDTGVRAYKGQAGNLISNNDVLTAALQIHSVEARHASHIRQMRKASGVDVKPWITGEVSGIGAAVAASYAGENTTNQGGVEIVGINGQAISSDDATESFDEPLTRSAVEAIVDPFIV